MKVVLRSRTATVWQASRLQSPPFTFMVDRVTASDYSHDSAANVKTTESC